MPQLLVSDVDGTLLDAQGQLPPETRAALQRWVDAGQWLAFATGRNARITLPLAAAIDRPMFLVLQDGCLIRSFPDESVLVYHNLPSDVLAAALAHFHQAGMAVMVFDPLPDGLSFCLADAIAPSPGLARYLARHRGQYRGSSGPISAASKLVTLDTAARTAAMAAELQAALPTARILRTEAVRLDAWFLEVGPAAGSKRQALEALLAHLNLQAADVIAVGDAENDIEMLRLAGLGVAMGNASPRVKAAADRVIASNHNGGLAHFVNEYLAELTA